MCREEPGGHLGRFPRGEGSAQSVGLCSLWLSCQPRGVQDEAEGKVRTNRGLLCRRHRVFWVGCKMQREVRGGFYKPLVITSGVPWWKRIRLQCGRPEFDPWVGKIPWRRERLPTPVFWPGEFHGLYRRSRRIIYKNNRTIE